MPQFPQLTTALLCRVQKAQEAWWPQSLLKASGALISFKGSESVSVPQHLIFPPNIICMERTLPPAPRATQEITSRQVKRLQGRSLGPESSSSRLPAGRAVVTAGFQQFYHNQAELRAPATTAKSLRGAGSLPATKAAQKKMLREKMCYLTAELSCILG